jgi:hypothetical protein
LGSAQRKLFQRSDLLPDPLKIAGDPAVLLPAGACQRSRWAAAALRSARAGSTSAQAPTRRRAAAASAAGVGHRLSSHRGLRIWTDRYARWRRDQGKAPLQAEVEELGLDWHQEMLEIA